MALFKGTPLADVINGLNEDDIILANAGNDLIFAHGGNDTVHAGEDNDTVYGGLGDDYIHGNAGDDALFGDQGNDILLGDAGNDTLNGGAGNDELYGAQLDSMNPGTGEVDVLTGGEGADIFVLGVRNNPAHFYVGNGISDRAQITDFNANEDVAQLQGSISDYFMGVQANASGGYDTVLSYKVDGQTYDQVAVFEGMTQLDLTSDAVYALEDAPVVNITLPPVGSSGTTNTIIFDDADNLILATAASDAVFAHGGDDIIRGFSGEDIIHGNEGDDYIHGDAGNDSLFGDEGHDILLGDAGNDLLNGGLGNDELAGAQLDVANPGTGEVDILTGGGGADIFVFGTRENPGSYAYLGQGDADYALVTDFNAAEGDVIQLQGSVSEYSLGVQANVNGGHDTVLYHVGNNGQSYDQIAILQNVSGLDLTSDAFYTLG